MLIFQNFISRYENFSSRDSLSTQIGPRAYPHPTLMHAAGMMLMHNNTPGTTSRVSVRHMCILKPACGAGRQMHV